MAYGFFKILKGLVIKEEGTNTPKEIDIIPGGSASTKTTITSSQTVDRTITYPDATDTLVAKNTTDTLTNKTLTAPVISTIVNTGTLSLPTATTTLVGTNTSDTLTNKVLSGNTATNLVNGAGTLTLNTSGNATIPNATDTLVGKNTTDTLTNKTIAAGSNTITGLTKSDVGLGNVDNTSDATKNSATATLTNKTLTSPVINSPTGIVKADVGLGNVDNTSDATKNAAAVTLTNKTLDNTNTVTLKDALFTLQDDGDTSKQAKFQLSGITTATTRTMTVPDANTTLVGTDTTQTLTNKTLTTPVISSISNTGTVTLPTTTTTLVGTNTTDTLTNKTLTSPTINSGTINTPTIDVATLDGQASTPSNPASGFYKAYVKDTTGKLTILNSTGTETTVGSGSSSINYITNGDAEVDTTGWNKYTDSAQAKPIDGTGGTPNADLNISRSTSSPLRGTGSFLISKNAAVTTQGSGFSYDFTIDSADQAKIIQISFDYTLVSGTFQVGTSSQDSDMIVYIYDVTNAVTIEPAGFKLDAGVAGVKLKFQGTFQSSSNSTSYRLILHKGTTNSAAFDLKFDNVVVGPEVVSIGAAISDSKNITPTTTNLGFTAGTNTLEYWRVGDKLYCKGFLTYSSGSGSASNFTVTLPESTVIDTNKLGSTSGTLAEFGSWTWYDDAGSSSTLDDNFGPVVYDTTTTVKFRIPNTSNAFVTNVMTTNDTFSYSFIVPISGWSSNTTVSSDTDTRIVDLTLSGNPNNTITSSTSKMTWASTPVGKDSHSGWDQTNSQYVIPISGDYFVSMQTEMAGTEANDNFVGLQIFNASTSTNLANFYSRVQNTTLSTNLANGSILLTNLKAGDKLEFRSLSTITSPTYANTLTGTTISLMRLSGPSQIAASESVNCRVTGDPASATVGNPIIVPTVSFDSHSSYNNSTGRYTIPVSGVYNFFGALSSASSATTLSIYKNAVSDCLVGNLDSNGEATFSGLVKCVAGDLIDIRPGGTVDATSMTLNIVRVGN